MRRVMCVWCPLWPVQRLLSAQPELRERPLLLFAEGRRGLLVSDCSPEAAQLGIRVGMPLGEARSLLPMTAARPKRRAEGKPVWQRADRVADRARLQTLSLHCQRYSPLVGMEDASEPESLWLDISGSEALFGGEQGLVDALRMDFVQQGLRVRIAVADSWGAAWAVSHFGESPETLVPSNQQATALAPLSVAALRIPGKVIELLRTLDVSTIGRLMRLPRESLPSRLGKELLRRLDQALGLAPEMLAPERLVEPIFAEWLFEEPVSDRQTLDHVCEALLERVLTVLDERKAGLRELNCQWLGTTADPILLRLLRPTTDRRHLLDLLRLYCERCVFASPVAGVRLKVVELGLPPIRQTTLFENDTDDRRQRSLAELIDRLSSRLGRQAVLRASLSSDSQPEFSSQSVPYLDALAATKAGTAVTTSRLRCRPLRLLRCPKPLLVQQSSPDGCPSRVGRSEVLRVTGPERIETGWWRGPDTKRDYYRLDMANGASLWAFNDRHSGLWFLHGLFV